MGQDSSHFRTTCHSFRRILIPIWWHFPPNPRTSSSIAYTLGLLVTTYFSLMWKCHSLLFSAQDPFAGWWIQARQLFFSFSALCRRCSRFFRPSEHPRRIHQAIDSFWRMYQFSFAAFKFCFSSWDFNFNSLTLVELGEGRPPLGSPCSLFLSHCTSVHFKFYNYFFKYFLCCVYYLLSLGFYLFTCWTLWSYLTALGDLCLYLVFFFWGGEDRPVIHVVFILLMPS